MLEFVRIGTIEDIYGYIDPGSIGSGNGLMSDGTKSLPEQMLISHYWCFMAFTWEQSVHNNILLKLLLFKIPLQLFSRKCQGKSHRTPLMTYQPCFK